MNEKTYKKQLEDQLKDEAYYSKEEAPKLYPEINENWRLPTIEELNLMYENLHRKGVGGFATEYYWSSSEHNAIFAWFQNFYFGFQNYYNKDIAFRVRAVRTFKSNEECCIRDETNTGTIFWKDENTYKVCKPDDEKGHFTWNQAVDLFKENHGTKKLNKLLDKAKNMSIEEYRELYNRAMRNERNKIDDLVRDANEKSNQIQICPVCNAKSFIRLSRSRIVKTFFFSGDIHIANTFQWLCHNPDCRYEKKREEKLN